jgi:hypothetical protein
VAHKSKYCTLPLSEHGRRRAAGGGGAPPSRADDVRERRDDDGVLLLGASRRWRQPGLAIAMAVVVGRPLAVVARSRSISRAIHAYCLV